MRDERAEPDAHPTLLRLPSVMRMTGLARSTIYKLIAQKQFPAPVKLSERAVAWLQPEIDKWIGSRTRSSSSAQRATFRMLQN